MIWKVWEVFMKCVGVMILFDVKVLVFVDVIVYFFIEMGGGFVLYYYFFFWCNENVVFNYNWLIICLKFKCKFFLDCLSLWLREFGYEVNFLCGFWI